MKQIISKIKWHISELTKMYSDQPSFYSKKRIESGIAFIVGQYLIIHGFIYLLLHDKISSSDIALLAGVEFALCGYQLNKIQQEKNGNNPDTQS